MAIYGQTLFSIGWELQVTPECMTPLRCYSDVFHICLFGPSNCKVVCIGIIREGKMDEDRVQLNNHKSFNIVYHKITM